MSLKKGLKGPWRNRNVRCLIKCLLDSGRPTMQVLGICHVILTLNSIVIQPVVFGQNIKVIQGSRHAGLDPASSRLMSAKRAGLVLLDTGIPGCVKTIFNF